MHLYNAWLPPPVAEATKREAESFSSVLRSVRASWHPDDPDSVYSTLKWIAIIDLFIKAKSEVCLQDIKELVEFGLELFYASQNKLYAQVRWGTILVKLLKKYGKRLTLAIQWRPLYDTLMQTHFTRNTGPEGWKLRQRHFETMTSLVRSCRKFFSSGSASEIWLEFRASMENPWHNSSFEGAGFVRLFLPMNPENESYFTSDWVKECLDLWDSVPNCQFWDIQWASVIARCTKNCKAIDWEQFLPVLFTRYLNMFEVPVSNATGSYPFPLEVHRNTRFLFSSKMGTPAKAIAKSIVYLLKPGSSAQESFEILTNLLEQYYHPSNGGRWTNSLERFLRQLVIAFQKRLQQEQIFTSTNGQHELCLGKLERSLFVKMMLKLIDRGQYSKNESLSETVAVATSMLAYVEPSLVLPFIASRFHLALETMTATHQLKTAVTAVAFAGRALSLASLRSPQDDSGATDTSMELLVISLSNALLGMDANDPPKTLATMQLIGSIFSNLTEVGVDEDGPAFLQSISFSEWLDEFFCRLFSLLQHLEPSSAINEDARTSIMSGTFLVEDSPYYFCMLEILLGKLSRPLFSQSLRKISKFINTNILPGATAEVGLLCCACVRSNPEEASVNLIKPMLISINSSLRGTQVPGFGGRAVSGASFPTKATLPPALETSIEFHLKTLAIAINYGGPVLLNYRDELKEAIASAFQAPSWKVNVAGDHLLRSLLGSLVLYYPIDQYKPFSYQSATSILEEWGCSKNKDNGENEQLNLLPKWHIPNQQELFFANELLNFHLQSALDDLLTICQTKMHTDAGNEKEHFKVTLLRIYSSLQGVMSCLPEMRPVFKNKGTAELDGNYFLIAGAVGSSVGSSELREKAAQNIHIACEYLLKERSDDSVLLMLAIRIMDALGNFGNLEYEEWSNHIQAWKLESAAIIEPPCNFIVCSHAQGKKRPRWALIDKAYMHNLWRCSQQSYHKFRMDFSLSPSEHMITIIDDLLNLSLHNYETVRSFAGRSLSMMLKRWPSLIAKCVLTLSGNLHNPKAPEHVVLGSCVLLSTQTILRHLTTDGASFSSFIKGLLASSHHESLKAQKAITELFVKYNIHFSGIPRSFFKNLDGQTNAAEFSSLTSQISSLSFDTNGLHWRYNLMANRVLLLLTLSSRTDSNLSSKLIGETAGHFLRNLKSQLPQSRMLAISALNTLLQGAPHKNKNLSEEQRVYTDHLKENSKYSLGETLSQIFREDGFFSETLNSLSHVHIITDTESTASRGNHGTSSIQSLTDKAITFFYFDFSASWPRTPSWISLLGGDTFYSNFARIFKRLAQECGKSVLLGLQNVLEEFSCAKERSKQCVAAEALGGILHSDIDGILEVWDSWIMHKFEKIIVAPTVDSIPEWAACIRYAVTGKGKYGTRVPLLRHQILDCLAKPLPQTLATNVVAKRYAFLSVVLLEISPHTMPAMEVKYHYQLLEELLNNLDHASAQVREVIGIALSVICSNLRLSAMLGQKDGNENMVEFHQRDDWPIILTHRASELAMNIQNANQSGKMESLADMMDENANTEAQADARRMETMFHFIISSLKSGRSSHLLDVIVGLLYPVISLQETSNKDLCTLAKAAFELLKWRILPRPFLGNALSVILSSANDTNWRTRFASLTYLRTFVYRHTFTLLNLEKQQIWKNIESLLADNQVEVREHAAGVLASLMKGGDEDLYKDFRDRAYAEAHSIQAKRKQRNRVACQSVASIHGAVLALAASVLSVPYDMPSWLPEHITLLARFINEPSPVKSTVTKTVAEFRRTHADTWSIQKEFFTEEQLEVLADTSSSSSYFA